VSALRASSWKRRKSRKNWENGPPRRADKKWRQPTCRLAAHEQTKTHESIGALALAASSSCCCHGSIPSTKGSYAGGLNSASSAAVIWCSASPRPLSPPSSDADAELVTSSAWLSPSETSSSSSSSSSLSNAAPRCSPPLASPSESRAAGRVNARSKRSAIAAFSSELPPASIPDASAETSVAMPSSRRKSPFTIACTSPSPPGAPRVPPSGMESTPSAVESAIGDLIPARCASSAVSGGALRPAM
jgi:hypothetical protein